MGPELHNVCSCTATLEHMNCLRECSTAPKQREGKKQWIIQREARINAMRRKISHIMLTIECTAKNPSTYTRRQRRVIASVKARYKSSDPEKLTAKLGLIKHDLRMETTSLQDDITRADRNSINRIFTYNPKLIYRKWRGEQFDVTNPPSKEEIHDFWSGIWSKPSNINLESPWYENVQNTYCTNVSAKHYEISPVVMKEILSKIPNNRSPGSDLITGYWIKNFTALHEQLRTQLSALKTATL